MTVLWHYNSGLWKSSVALWFDMIKESPYHRKSRFGRLHWYEGKTKSCNTKQPFNKDEYFHSKAILKGACIRAQRNKIRGWTVFPFQFRVNVPHKESLKQTDWYQNKFKLKWIFDNNWGNNMFPFKSQVPIKDR